MLCGFGEASPPPATVGEGMRFDGWSFFCALREAGPLLAAHSKRMAFNFCSHSSDKAKVLCFFLWLQTQLPSSLFSLYTIGTIQSPCFCLYATSSVYRRSHRCCCFSLDPLDLIVKSKPNKTRRASSSAFICKPRWRSRCAWHQRPSDRSSLELEAYFTLQFPCLPFNSSKAAYCFCHILSRSLFVNRKSNASSFSTLSLDVLPVAYFVRCVCTHVDSLGF
mmetsp:Transcript_21083/g.38112  ORF Transcript_21083/g.38112 Transcript_21083/m.38112 type:complete len:221 (-) Transcript_21083:931-1593(-)